MEKKHSRTENGYEFIPLPKAPEREEIPEILRDALEMKHFTLPKLPKKYRLPEVLQKMSSNWPFDCLVLYQRSATEEPLAPFSTKN